MNTDEGAAFCRTGVEMNRYRTESGIDLALWVLPGGFRESIRSRGTDKRMNRGIQI